MPLTFSLDTTRRMHASIKKFMAEHFDEELGDLKAGLLLEFCLKEIGPSVYNQGIADAQAYFTGRVQDLEGVCYEPEFSYWSTATLPPGRRLKTED
jgi:uncharacterized protein (DUF2164 family)